MSLLFKDGSRVDSFAVNSRQNDHPVLLSYEQATPGMSCMFRMTVLFCSLLTLECYRRLRNRQ